MIRSVVSDVSSVKISDKKSKSKRTIIIIIFHLKSGSILHLTTFKNLNNNNKK